MKNRDLYNNVFLSPVLKVVIVAATLWLTACDQKTDKNELKESIMKANQEWMDAVRQRDADAVAAMYTGDALLLAPNTPAIHGEEGVKSFFSGAINSGVQNIKLVTEEVDGDGQTAIEKGTYEMMVEGDKVVDKGKYLVYWKNVNGKWMFHRDMFNSDMPAASKPLAKGNVIGLHVTSVKPKSGVTRDQFMEFYNNTVIPEFAKHWPEAKVYVVKGLRGEHKNKFGFVYFFESQDVRNKYFNDDGSVTETGQAIVEKMKPTFDQLSKTYGSSSTVYTDWLLQ